jgi:hypothetical protein
VLSFAIFPNYERGFITYRGTEALSKIGWKNQIDNILFSLRKLVEIMHDNLLYTLVLILLSVVVCYLLWVERKRLLIILKNLKDIQALPIILFSTFIWLSVIIVSPLKLLRYIVPVFPLFSLLIPYIISKLNNQKVFVVSVLFCIGIYGVIAFNKERIDFLYLGAYHEMKFNQEPEIPVIIYNHNYGEGGFWKNASILPYVANNQKYEFPYTNESLLEKAMKYERAILLIETTENIDVERAFCNFSLEKFDFEYSEYYTAYQITLNKEYVSNTNH